MTATANQPQFDSFELLVGARHQHGYPVTTIEAPAGDAGAVCHLDAADPELRDALAAIEASDTDAGFLADVGSLLFEELLAGEVGQLFQSSLTMARAQGRHLRLRLRVEPPELAALPWEYLYNPAEETFLAISAETALVRYVPLRLPARPTKVTPPLRVLVAISSPRDLAALEVDQERRLIADALQGPVDQGLVQLKFVQPATVDAITEAMRAHSPHIFHFIGHGTFQGERAFVLLEDDRGHARLIDECSFREFFLGAADTRVAVINACQTAAVSTTRPLTGLAPRLLQRKLSAVAAMQHTMSDRGALAFTREFYRCLAAGVPVDAAVSEARKGVFLELGADQRDWGTPVLFLRARDGQLFEIEQPERGTALEIPPPPEPARPPVIVDFVGREAALAAYRHQLATAHLAVITGMAGVGKTALAAQLSTETADADRIFWHSFRQGEGIEVIVWEVAAFLAWHGRDDLWRMLQGTRLTGGQPPPADVLVSYLVQAVRGHDYLLVLDDFHHVDEDPLTVSLMQAMREPLRRGDLSVILVSRRAPARVTLISPIPLEGMNVADIVALARARGIALSRDQIERLHQHTGGNAELLNLALNVLLDTGRPERLLERLAGGVDVERYLLTEVDQDLKPEEREILTAVAVLLDQPAPRDCVEISLDQDNILRTLHYLCSRYLLVDQVTDRGHAYREHAILQRFYYEMLSRRERRELHRRVATYFEAESDDRLQAARHYHLAGDVARAAELVTADVWSLINRGQAQALWRLLEQFSGTRFDSSLAARVATATGQVASYIGDRAAALHSFEAALVILNDLRQSTEQRILVARACRGMAETLSYTDPQLALEWLYRGAAELQESDDFEEAALRCRMGNIQIDLGRYEAAQQSLDLALSRLPAKPNQWQVIALMDQANLFYCQGDLGQYHDVSSRALATSQQLEDHARILVIKSNLGISHYLSGDFSGALDNLEEALALAERLGSRQRKAMIKINLGIVLARTGDFDSALVYLEGGLRLAAEAQLHTFEIAGKASLADLHLRLGQPGTALSLLAEAQEIAEAIGAKGQLPEIYRVRAEAELAAMRPYEALEHARHSVALAEELDMAFERAMSLRVLGSALAANGQEQEALATFGQSTSALAERDPFEAARAQMAWGMTLAAFDADRGRALISQARETFARLGAAHELEVAEGLLAGFRTFCGR